VDEFFNLRRLPVDDRDHPGALRRRHHVKFRHA
jgi:hypothetical protein